MRRCCVSGKMWELRPYMQPPEDADPDLAPVWQGLGILVELHRKRNHLPIAETIRQMLASVRAHAAFARKRLRFFLRQTADRDFGITEHRPRNGLVVFERFFARNRCGSE